MQSRQRHSSASPTPTMLPCRSPYCYINLYFPRWTRVMKGSSDCISSWYGLCQSRNSRYQDRRMQCSMFGRHGRIEREKVTFKWRSKSHSSSTYIRTVELSFAIAHLELAWCLEYIYMPKYSLTISSYPQELMQSVNKSSLNFNLQRRVKTAAAFNANPMRSCKDKRRKSLKFWKPYPNLVFIPLPYPWACKILHRICKSEKTDSMPENFLNPLSSLFTSWITKSQELLCSPWKEIKHMHLG